jgi:co-chaperonin GroES (HSP10)
VDLPKSFSVGMGGGPVTLTLEEQREAAALREEREAEALRVQAETKARLERIASQKVTRKLIPYGTRILVKRRKVEDKSSHIILPDEVKNLPTDIADVVEVPEQSFTDQKLIANAGNIIEGLTLKACGGDALAVDALLKFREYLQVMTIKRGDVLLMARYGGTDFLIQETNSMLCVVEATGIYCLVKEIVQPIAEKKG